MNSPALAGLAAGALALGFIVLATTRRGERSGKALAALVCILTNGFVLENAIQDKGCSMALALAACFAGLCSAVYVLIPTISAVQTGATQGELHGRQ